MKLWGKRRQLKVKTVKAVEIVKTLKVNHGDTARLAATKVTERAGE